MAWFRSRGVLGLPGLRRSVQVVRRPRHGAQSLDQTYVWELDWALASPAATLVAWLEAWLEPCGASAGVEKSRVEDASALRRARLPFGTRAAPLRRRPVGHPPRRFEEHIGVLRSVTAFLDRAWTRRQRFVSEPAPSGRSDQRSIRDATHMASPQARASVLTLGVASATVPR